MRIPLLDFQEGLTTDKHNSTLKKPKSKKDADIKKEESPIIISKPYVKGVSEALTRAY